MADTLSRAGCFMAIIALGYFLKKHKFFPDSAFEVLSQLVIKVTLPATIILNYAGKTFDLSMLSIVLISLGANVCYMLIILFIERKETEEERAFDVINTPGYNIGTFTLPFVQSFMGPTGVIATSLFDTGNGFISLGGSYSIASMIKSKKHFSLWFIGKTLVKSLPFMTYIVMLTLSLLHLSLPNVLLEFFGIIGNANAYLAMLMIGVGFHLEMDKEHLGHIAKILVVRYGFAVLVALFCWFVLPFTSEVRKALVLLSFSPTASASISWTANLDGDTGMASALSSVSILCSMVIMLLLLIMFP